MGYGGNCVDHEGGTVLPATAQCSVLTVISGAEDAALAGMMGTQLRCGSLSLQPVHTLNLRIRRRCKCVRDPRMRERLPLPPC